MHNVDNLTQITIASNVGTFLVYGLTNAIVLVAFAGRRGRSIVRHVMVPVIGLLANVAMLGAVIFESVSAGGSTQTDTLIALAFVGVWIAIGAVWLVINSARQKRPLLTRPAPAARSPSADRRGRHAGDRSASGRLSRSGSGRLPHRARRPHRDRARPRAE